MISRLIAWFVNLGLHPSIDFLPAWPVNWREMEENQRLLDRLMDIQIQQANDSIHPVWLYE